MGFHRYYFDKKFYPRSDGYWVCTTSSALHAHRWVWMKHFGDIPSGYHIHHKDGNPSNNEIENLELLPAGDHIKLHTSKPAAREQARQACILIAPILAAWNKSPEGQAFRKKEGAKITQNTKPIKICCPTCHKEMETRTYHKKFCSRKCKDVVKKERAKVDRSCIICGTIFRSVKFKKARFCSSSCSIKHQWNCGGFQNRKSSKNALLH
jgi:hypothetical protein